MLIKNLSYQDVENLKNLLLLKFSRGVGTKIIRKVLVDKISSDKSYLFSSTINPTYKSNVNEKDVLNCINKYIENDVGILLYGRFDYPNILAHIDDPPPILFYKGNIDSLKISNSIAIIGTRKPNTVSLNRVKEFVLVLSNYDISVISGLAFGIDRQAHLSALENNMYTIAVLASSVDICTPAANEFVYEKILSKNGLILSENTSLDIIGPYSFAKRNRIIAGLAKNVLFVEGTTESGALITCNLAFDYNRNVFALPSEPNTKSGGNLLIRQDKARLVEDPYQLIEDLGLIKKKYNIDDIKLTLTKDEILVLSLIDKNGTDIDTIVSKTNFELDKIMMILLMLECKNVVFKNSGLYFLV